jgi:hypothetical protein
MKPGFVPRAFVSGHDFSPAEFSWRAAPSLLPQAGVPSAPAFRAMGWETGPPQRACLRRDGAGDRREALARNGQQFHTLGAGHFTLKMKADEIAALVRDFMETQK